MKRLLHTPLALLVWRIALLYAALMLCRAAFWVYNAALLGPPVWSELGQLVAGSLKFDTVSVVYADGVFILLSLLPLHLRERRWYRGMLFWYYVIVNAVLIAAANLADTVYFRYTQKRFTADEIFFADNDNSLQLVGKFMAENWYLVLLWIALTALLAVVCALCLGRTALQLVQYRQGDETYAQAQELAGLPDLPDLPVVDVTGGSGEASGSAGADGAGEAPEEVPVWQDPYAQALKDMDFSALRQQNPDVLGWILIPGTRVSYPVVQGTDNSYYLDHTWRGGKNS